MRKPILAAATQLAALAWTIAILVDSTPLEPTSALLAGIGLLSTSTVAIVGMIVVGGRWAHRLAVAVLAYTYALAIIRPMDPAWWVAIAVSALATTALLSPHLLQSIRKLPSASGPPPRAVAPALILLGTPAVLGLVGDEATTWALMLVGLSAPGVALLYSRVFPGGLVGIRLVWPIMVIAVSPLLGLYAGALAAAIAVTVAVLAWDRSVKASYHPPQEVGTTYAIPPELAPGEILDAADLDERGRPR